MMQITGNTGVSFEYTLTDDSENILDAAEGREALAYIHGEITVCDY